MKNIYKYLIAFALGGLAIFLILKEDKVDVEVPIDIDFTTPTIIKEFDTVYITNTEYIKLLTEGKKEIDSVYFEEYNKLKDSVDKAELFKKAISINTYNERVEDDTLKIDLHMKTRGDLLLYHVKYKVKPLQYTIDTTITVPIPQSAKFFVGADVILPSDLIKMKPSIEPGVLLVNKESSKTYRVGYDPLNKVWNAGVYFRL